MKHMGVLRGWYLCTWRNNFPIHVIPQHIPVLWKGCTAAQDGLWDTCLTSHSQSPQTSQSCNICLQLSYWAFLFSALWHCSVVTRSFLPRKSAFSSFLSPTSVRVKDTRVFQGRSRMASALFAGSRGWEEVCRWWLCSAILCSLWEPQSGCSCLSPVWVSVDGACQAGLMGGALVCARGPRQPRRPSLRCTARTFYCLAR